MDKVYILKTRGTTENKFSLQSIHQTLDGAKKELDRLNKEYQNQLDGVIVYGILKD